MEDGEGGREWGGKVVQKNEEIYKGSDTIWANVSGV